MKSTGTALATAAWLLAGAVAHAAALDGGDEQALRAQARQHGRAAVVVDLQPMPLAEVLGDSAVLRDAARARAAGLRAELGAEAVLRWDNGIGQLQLDLTEQGLALLQRSTQAWRWRAAGDGRPAPVAGDDGAAAVVAGDGPAPNVPMGEPALGTSVVSTNMTRAHSLGFAGAGAMVAIVDSGVQKDHPAFQRTDGSSRVTYEACFGTNSDAFKSICPSPATSGDGIGDSAVNTPGSGSPKAGCTSSQCSHGTHLAGIAAGNQGMAPQAEIASLQVFSYTDNGLATAFYGDLLQALNTVYAQAKKETTANALVVSIGTQAYKTTGEGWSAACDSYNSGFSSVAATIKQLWDVGVAVIAPVGNKGLNGAVAFPACLSRVVKVAAAENTAAYATAPVRWGRSNLAPPAALGLTGVTPALWLAPGAPVVSAVVGGGTAGLGGTSQAAAHVAGMYAALKGANPAWTVTQLNEYIRASASAAVQISLPSGAGPNPPQSVVEFRYVLVPN